MVVELRRKLHTGRPRTDHHEGAELPLGLRIVLEGGKHGALHGALHRA